MSRKRNKKAPLPQYLLDIIVVVYGRYDLLTKCLDSIAGAFSEPYRVVLYDNDSPDSDKSFYDKYRGLPNYKITLGKKNLGFPKGNNTAFMNLGNRSPLTFFLNSDVILEEGSGDELLKSMDDVSVGVAGMKLLYPHEASPGLDQNIRPPGKIQHAGISMGLNAHTWHLFNSWDRDHPRPNALHEMWAITGAALMTRSHLFKDNRFDLQYGKGTYEDVDYCLTIREKGYKIVINPQAEAYHFTNASVEFYGEGFPLQENYQYFMAKWKDTVTWTDWMYL